MYKNYFLLNRIVLEFNSILNGFTITEIFSQEKDSLILKCENGSDKYIEVSVNPGAPYITLRNDYRRARRNSIDFFSQYLPVDINKFEISDHDRLIRINCEKVKFYFAVRGKHTNFFIGSAENRLSSFKNADESYLTELRKEFPGHNFISDRKKIEFKTPDLDFDDYKKKYPFLGSEIINEAKARYTLTGSKKSSEYISRITEELLEGEPAVFLSSGSNELHLAVKTFHIFSADKIKTFDTIIEGVNYFIGKKYYLEAFTAKRKIVGKFIDRELSKLSSKMNDLNGRIERGTKEEDYNKIGNLLLINLNKIFPKTSSVEIEDIYQDNNTIKVKLDPKLSPQKNAEYYFTKAGNERIAYKKSKELYREVSENYRKLRSIKERFEITESLEEINNIMKELNIKSGEKRNLPDDMRTKFKHYVVDKKYDVYVGRDSANNDLLTMKFARQNDYWFHARSVPGSHVVLKAVNKKEPVPKNIIKAAASIAAFHSKAKTSGLVPVSYTFKKYVTKKKGMEPGKVALLKEDVLLVKPEIPSNCEFVPNE